MKRPRILLFLLCAVAAPATAQGPSIPSQCDAVVGNLVGNCGFEHNLLNQIWAQSMPSGPEIGDDGERIHSGGGAFAFGSNAPTPYISQTLSTIAGNSYTLSFWLYAAEGSDPAPFLPDADYFLHNQFFANWDGSSAIVLNDYNPFLGNNPDGSFPFVEFTVSGLVATSDATVIALGGYQNISAFVVDDVVVTQDQAQPVSTPEPSSVVLLGTGILGVAWRRRRARNVLK